MYTVILPLKIQRGLKKIDKKYRLKIAAALLVIEKNPFRGKKLEGEFKEKWSYRAWPYRIIYEIKKKELIILIVAVGQRQNIYK